MGIDRSVTVAYGFGGGEPPAALLRFLAVSEGAKVAWDEAEAMGGLLHSAGFPHLTYSVQGNFMSGECSWVVSASLDTYDPRDEEGSLYFLDEPPRGAALSELVELHDRLGLTHGEYPVGWLVAFNVS